MSIDSARAEVGAARLSPRATIMIVFFVQAFAGGGLFPRIPDIQAGLGLSAGDLGLTLLGQPIGALTSYVIASFLIERIGTKRLLSICIPLISMMTLLIALAPIPAFVFGAMFGYGLSFALANVAMNVEADRVEASCGQRVMVRCHGMWGFGFLAASIVGAAARGAALVPAMHLGLLLPLVLAVAATLIWPMRASAPRAHAGAATKRLFVVPRVTTVLLVGIALAGVMVDATVRTWSVIFMRDSFTVPGWVEALSLPAFLLMLSTGRLFGDALVERFGPVRLAASLLCVALLGLGLVLTARDLFQALAGFGLLGIGICVIYPLTISAAARIGGRPASENVTSVTLVMSLIMLGVPALMGFAAQQFGIRASFAILLPVLLLALLVVRRLDPKPTA